MHRRIFKVLPFFPHFFQIAASQLFALLIMPGDRKRSAWKRKRIEKLLGTKCLICFTAQEPPLKPLPCCGYRGLPSLMFPIGSWEHERLLSSLSFDYYFLQSQPTSSPGAKLILFRDRYLPSTTLSASRLGKWVQYFWFSGAGWHRRIISQSSYSTPTSEMGELPLCSAVWRPPLVIHKYNKSTTKKKEWTKSKTITKNKNSQKIKFRPCVCSFYRFWMTNIIFIGSLYIYIYSSYSAILLCTLIKEYMFPSSRFQ